ncbi:hypothetical protein PTKIN_Ptkin06aG0053500 [Pterospermum kingtungense]
MNPKDEKHSPNSPPNPPETLPFTSPTMEVETLSSAAAAGPGTDFTGVPQPLEILQGNPVPPFLSKTFDLADDTSMDTIISWGPTGESFVVWDPVEFCRLVLPRNFKHNNFSSFVRQLNTYGFRKIDTDKWEFANEAFQRGKKYLLKNIQRRKSPQSQQVSNYFGPSTEVGSSGLGDEIESLRKEKSMLMQEVVELQQQDQVTARHVEVVNQRLQSAEQRQKQMVSFLAKLFQNPAFIAHLRQRKEHGEIGSPRMRRKFLKHQQLEMVSSESPVGGQIVKYRPDCRNQVISSSAPDLNPVSVEQAPDYLPEGVAGIDLGAEDLPFRVDDEMVVSEELVATHGYLRTPEVLGERTSGLESEDLHFKGKNVMGSEEVVNPGYSVSFPEDLVKQQSTLELSSPIGENVAKQEDIWSMGFDATAGMPSSSTELWGNLESYDIPELGVTGGLSDVWDLGFSQAAEDPGTDKWPAEESPFYNPKY